MAQYILTTGDIDTDHIDAHDFFTSYGWSIECETRRYLELQCVTYDEAMSGRTAETVRSLMARYSYCTEYEARKCVEAAESVYSDGADLEAALARAVDAHADGDLETCLEALEEARHIGRRNGSSEDSDQLRAALITEQAEVLDVPIMIDPSNVGHTWRPAVVGDISADDVALIEAHMDEHEQCESYRIADRHYSW